MIFGTFLIRIAFIPVRFVNVLGDKSYIIALKLARHSNYAIITPHARLIHDLGAPRTSKTVLGTRLLRSLLSSDSFGGPRGAIIMNEPRWGVIIYHNTDKCDGARLREYSESALSCLLNLGFQRCDY